MNGPDRFNAHLFFLAKPSLAADIDDAFHGLDLNELTRDVLDSTPRNHHMNVIRALDDFFGDLGDDPEDGDA